MSGHGAPAGRGEEMREEETGRGRRSGARDGVPGTVERRARRVDHDEVTAGELGRYRVAGDESGAETRGGPGDDGAVGAEDELRRREIAAREVRLGGDAGARPRFTHDPRSDP